MSAADLKTIGTIDYMINSAVAAGFPVLVLIIMRACYFIVAASILTVPVTHRLVEALQHSIPFDQ